MQFQKSFASELESGYEADTEQANESKRIGKSRSPGVRDKNNRHEKRLLLHQYRQKQFFSYGLEEATKATNANNALINEACTRKRKRVRCTNRTNNIIRIWYLLRYCSHFQHKLENAALL
jgi:hypothetical protein